MTAAAEQGGYITGRGAHDTADPAPSLPRRLRRSAVARARLSWALLTRPARLLPGLGAIGCAVAGAWLLWSLGVALLVAVPFLLVLDLRTPRG